MENKPKKRKSIMAGKGFYIALFLCVAAIGISGYLLFFAQNNNAVPTVNKTEPVAENTKELLPGIKTGDEKTEKDKKTETKNQVSPTPTVKNDEVKKTEPAKTEEAPIKEPAPQSTSAPASAKPTNDGGYHLPLKGSVMQEHSVDSLVYNTTLGHWRVHPGMDILADAGTPVMAAASGEVVSVYQDDALGNTVTLRHADGMSTVYANLSSEVCVQEGWAVSAGDVIGFVGNSALSESSDEPHLHFEMLCQGEKIDPRDILLFE